MPVILIDPPVSAYSSPEAIRSWIQELEELRRRGGDQAAVRSAIIQAKRWLRQGEAGAASLPRSGSGR